MIQNKIWIRHLIIERKLTSAKNNAIRWLITKTRCSPLENLIVINAFIFNKFSNHTIRERLNGSALPKGNSTSWL